MKKILAIILCAISIFSLRGCSLFELKSCDLPTPDPNAGLIESGDFMYKIEGKGTDDESARIIKLSKEGLEKKELIFPESLDGLIVKFIGRNKIDLYGTPIKDTFYGKWETICIPPTVEFISKYALSATVDKTVYINYNENIDMFYEYAFVNEGVGNKLDIKIFTSKINLKSYYKCSTLKANTLYNLNEPDAKSFFWIDNVKKNNKLSPPPKEPTKEGFNFEGWYKEKECLNKWDFENDVTKTIEIEQGTEVTIEMQEREDYATILFAKWIAA